MKINKEPEYLISKVRALEGPICVIGTGGFIGFNLFNYLVRIRSDVFGVCRDIRNNWRFRISDTPRSNLVTCDLQDPNQVSDLFQSTIPKTVFNLAAHGAYSKQREYRLIYNTNFNATVDLLELLKHSGLKVYLHAGSNSEYGLNCVCPDESGELIPNSHYALSKVASSYAIKYYGKIEKMPVANLRLYSVYGPWEEPDRLIPTLIFMARRKILPSLVDPDISRDFIHISDVISAFITIACEIQQSQYGDSFNVGTGVRTTISELAEKTKKLFNIPAEIKYGDLDNRAWDMPDWYGNIRKMRKLYNWRPEVNIDDGLLSIAEWQEEVKFDELIWRD